MARVLFISTVLMGVLVSCQGVILPHQAANPISPGIEGLQFEDIPIPSGFTGDDFYCYGYDFQTFKIGQQLFRGNKDPEYIYDFYKVMMPQNNWQLVTESKDYFNTSSCYKKSIHLAYIKELEKVAIDIYYESPNISAIKIKRGLK